MNRSILAAVLGLAVAPSAAQAPLVIGAARLSVLGPDGSAGPAMRDPSAPGKLRADLQSGDWLHPNDAGYRVMGDAVDLKLFR
jgi:lysophospholipase L1-like esterase